MFNLNDRFINIKTRKILIVGASSGIGHAIGVELMKKGAEVFVTARRRDLLEKTFSKSNIFPADITKYNEVQNLFFEIEEKKIRLDTVFWCPGIYTPMKSNDFNTEEAEQILTTNITSVYRLFSLIVRYWLQNKDLYPQTSLHWIWVSSVAGYSGLPGSVAYGPSKAAMNNLAEANYIELKPKGINISLVCPGFVESRLTKKNNFNMPFLITPQKAAKEILNGLHKGKFEIHFPKMFTYILKFLKFLPYWMYFKIVKKIN